MTKASQKKVLIEFSQELHEEIKTAAKRMGLPFATYCRLAAVSMARADLAQPLPQKPDWASET